MTEDSDETPLRPAEDQRIRALLADLGSGPDGESMPPEVADRLDATLARLVAEREADTGAEEPGTEESEAVASPAAAGGATVVPLRRDPGRTRSRRWATRGAAAAAAVIVVAGGGVAAAHLGLFGGATSSESSAGGSSAASGAEPSPGPSTQDLASPGPSARTPGSDAGGATASAPVPALTAASFRAQVTTLLGDGAALSSPTERGRRREVTLSLVPSASPTEAAPSTDGTTPSPAQVGSCLSPPLPAGARVTAITFDGAPAVLVVRPGVQGRRLVEAWSCGGSQRLAQTRVAVEPGAP